MTSGDLCDVMKLPAAAQQHDIALLMLTASRMLYSQPSRQRLIQQPQGSLSCCKTWWSPGARFLSLDIGPQQPSTQVQQSSAMFDQHAASHRKGSQRPAAYGAYRQTDRRQHKASRTCSHQQVATAAAVFACQGRFAACHTGLLCRQT
jgi:hypothetical protein